MKKKKQELLSKLKNRKNNHKTTLERYNKNRKKDIIILSIIVFLFFSLILFINSPYVKLNTINIYGIDRLDRNDILNKINIKKDVKIWDVNENSIKDKIKKEYTIISDVNVEVKYFQTLNINIKERKVLAKELKPNENKYYIVLDNGEYYEGILNKDNNLPILENFKNNNKKNNVLKNLSELKFEVLTYISEIYSEDSSNDTIIIYMVDGQKIKANAVSFYNKLNYYFDIEQHIENKKNTVLNIVNGVYLENDKTVAIKESKIKEILTSKYEENKNSEKNDKEKQTDKNKINNNKKETNKKITNN